MGKKTIAEHAKDVLIETDNPAVMAGDNGLLGLIAERSEMAERHPLGMQRRVLAALEGNPLFTKSKGWMRGRWVRKFTLVEMVKRESIG